MPSPNAIGVRVVIIDDPPNLPDIVGNAVADLSPQVTPTFGSTGDRDVAYASIPFKLCIVGNTLYMRRSSGWVKMLADPDIDTGWMAPNMSAGWVQLGSNPVKYRISAGMCELDGTAYYNGTPSMPGTSSVLSIPSNALPSNAAGFQQNAHTQAIAAAALTNSTWAPGFVNLRSGGSLVCSLYGGPVTGVNTVPLNGVRWRLAT